MMRVYKPDFPDKALYQFAHKLRGKGKHFNVASVALANKLARIVYACLTTSTGYRA